MTFEQRQAAQRQTDYDAFKAAEKVKADAQAARMKQLGDQAIAKEAAQKAALQKQADAAAAKVQADRDARAQVEIERMTAELRSAWVGTSADFQRALPTLLANLQQKRAFDNLNERRAEHARMVRSWM